jgi:opacity protein-like surface antigen
MIMPRLSLFAVAVAVAVAVTLGASTLAAQVATPPAPPLPPAPPVPTAPGAKPVGSLPENSPFRDIGPDGSRFGFVAGYLFTKTDEAGVGPKSMPLFGIRHDLHIAGPAYMTTRLLGGSTSRTILDYTKKAALRDVGTKKTAMIAGDIGITMSATGDRTWHNLQPLINVGVGIASFTGDQHTDISGFRLGTKFEFTYGLGARYITGKNSELRFDLSWYAWQLKYPTTYRSTGVDPVAIRPTGTLSPWAGNRLLSVGYTFGIFR